ncbi:MAG: tRNA dihydrouridine synthase DusB [Roseofilum sp. SBFL]|uniref:tRNA dihydrouridine synthase DusB n=1 Tax=unclassified Roseofilum TaxID=2620099 RepID=UPI000E8C05CA|nr:MULTISPECIES: tRNA dihydrouridine synthase DusB [unclassified Roseofilum]HBR00199.1 tRNA dihydrouridine synthase DusB [Cyanobacteria bacterium UBA11691]MBP0014200.1 tRNA dihydrouridine synthase DusB [Roseofilum sp. SID3]MBP0025109.1 tRNA dihydrouridine synthase DusB [Roseofilum sp. SID2]MBP0034028.1 tRNA dihydrouridine synthase DusB [Roseofilum sp. Belize BBD 4]MBP0038014.1 tRNA dihydrouridine synthase DusB [Roseofilum sp. SID1]
MVALSPELQARLSSPLKIGTVEVNSRVLQSPLSGVTDLVFRRLVRRYAPSSMMYTEMVNATGLHYVRELPKLMEVDPNERPISIQLFDCRPDFLAEAAQMAVDEGADTVDINMGCPVNKITKNGGGSSLLREPEIAEAIVREVAQAVEVPVTVKTRIGWSNQEINILEFAQRMQDAGAKMLTLHGRTRAQGYNGPARWEWITKVKERLSIPVIANGDIFSVEAAVRCLEETKADGVMCSRGTLGYPFLVGEIDYFLKTGEKLPEPTAIARLECAMEHLRALYEYKGDRGIRQARKHMTWYAKEFYGAGELRGKLARIESVEDGVSLLEGAIAKLMELDLDPASVPVG